MEKKYQVIVAGQSVFGPYIFQLDGRIAAEPSFFAAKDGKKAMCRVRLATDGNTWDYLAMAEGNPGAYADKPATGFLNVLLFGATAERAKNLAKGQPVMVTGKIVRETFKAKDGTEQEAVAIRGNDIKLRVGPDEAAPTGAISGIMRVNSDGKETPYACLAAGTVTNIGRVQVTPNGVEYVSLDVSLYGNIDVAMDLAKKEWSADKAYSQNTCKVRIWSPRQSLLERIAVGGLVFVTGPMSVYNGKYTISAAQIDLPFAAKKADGAATATSTPAEKPEAPTGEAETPAAPKKRGRKPKAAEEAAPAPEPAPEPEISAEGGSEDDGGDELPFELPF